jgi:hypothetical protein
MPRVTSVVDARHDEQVLLGFGVMGAAHMQHRMVADVPALTGATVEGMEVHTTSIMMFAFVYYYVMAWHSVPEKYYVRYSSKKERTKK